MNDPRIPLPKVKMRRITAFCCPHCIEMLFLETQSKCHLCGTDLAINKPVIGHMEIQDLDNGLPPIIPRSVKDPKGLVK